MIYIPFVYFTILFIYMWRKQKSINVSSLIVIFYIISSLFAIIIKNENLWNYTLNFPEIGIVPTFLYCSLLTISILPFHNFKAESIKSITLTNKKQFLVISWILIIISFVSLAIVLPQVKTTFTMDLFDVRKEYYQDAGTFYEFAGLPFYQYLINFAPSFSPIFILFFFYSVVYMDNKIYFNILLILASLILSVHSILTAARTQVIYWIMTFSAIYIFFKPLMTTGIKRKVKTLFVIIGLFVLIYMFAVTISRFENRNVGAVDSLILYTGQSFLQFCNVYNHYTFDEITIDRILPITSKYILDNKFTKTDYRFYQSVRIGADTGVFFTFLGDAMLDFGKFGMIIYTLIFYLISTKSLKRRNQTVISLSQMIIFVILVRFTLLGLFAYVYTSIQSSIMIIGSLIIAYLLKYKIKIY